MRRMMGSGIRIIEWESYERRENSTHHYDPDI